MNLKSEQEDLIRQFLRNNKKILNNKLSQGKWTKERNERHTLFNTLLSAKNIDNLSVENFKIIMKSLWAFGLWANKDYAVNKIIENNGFEKIKKSLKEILYNKESLETRYDNFKIKGLGTSSITEILVFIDPKKYCLWNEKPRIVLPHFGIDQPPKQVFKYSQITGNQYVKCIEVLESIRKILIDEGFKKIDFLDLDIFIWFAFDELKKHTNVPNKTSTIQSPIILKKPIFSPPNMTHWNVMGIILELGKTLGFDTYVADPSKKYKEKHLSDFATLSKIPKEYENIPGIKLIDVIWFPTTIPPLYLFEVEYKGTMRDALHRLYQLIMLQSKFFIISPSENRSKFEKYVATAPFKNIKNKYIFRSYEDLFKMYTTALNFHSTQSDFFENQ